MSAATTMLDSEVEPDLTFEMDSPDADVMAISNRSSRMKAKDPAGEIPIWYTEIPSPIGVLVVTSEGDAVTGLYMETHRHGPTDRGAWILDVNREREPLNLARRQLDEYFAGKRQTFDLPLKAHGTDVQKGVWLALREIPYGETRSYGELARQLGKPKASRAVGAANGRNPISIIVPCHRVIGADGSLTGFGGGLERKQWLLAHEARVRGETAQSLSDF